MTKIEASVFDISHLDLLSSRQTVIHRLDPRVKVATALFFIIIVVSFPKYEIASLVPFALYPAVLIALGNLPLGPLMKRILWAAPFAVLIGIFNPFLDSEVLLRLGPLHLSGGWVSFLALLLKFALTVAAALCLVATTGFNTICMALDRMGVPRIFAVQLSFLYRYIHVLADEAARMSRARALRSFRGKGMGMRVYSFMMGHLLIRTMDRAQRIHTAMLCRGFDGEIRMMTSLRIRPVDIGFLAGWCGLFVLLRLFDLSHWLGSTTTGMIP
ncbi:MAG: cobalt ECF transporter T component CbiQ [Syntrophobacteraceae bacterium]|nr:cobalt ECF transporter T component CbiQ [Syntrophobacteraceae bacterium]